MQRIDYNVQTPLQLARVDERIDEDFDESIAREVSFSFSTSEHGFIVLFLACGFQHALMFLVRVMVQRHQKPNEV